MLVVPSTLGYVRITCTEFDIAIYVWCHLTLILSTCNTGSIGLNTFEFDMFIKRSFYFAKFGSSS